MNYQNDTRDPLDNFEEIKLECEKALSGIDVHGMKTLQVTKNRDRKSDDEPFYKIYLSHINLNGNESKEHDYRHLLADTPAGGAVELVNSFIKQRDCEHDWSRAFDETGLVFSDGRGICEHCGLSSFKALNNKPGSIITMHNAGDLVARKPWPEKTFLQGGKRGVVITQKGAPNYATAFVETFPDIGEYSTFIRGEGDCIATAEAACFESYTRQMNCKTHTWTREVNGTHRDDGYAQCTNCKLRATALEPETKCTVCQKPTTNTLNGKHLCIEHQMALGADAYIEEIRDTPKYSIFSKENHTEADLASEYFGFLLKEKFMKEQGLEYLEKNSTLIITIQVKLESKLSEILFGDEFTELQTIEQAKSKEVREFLDAVFASQQ